MVQLAICGLSLRPHTCSRTLRLWHTTFTYLSKKTVLATFHGTGRCSAYNKRKLAYYNGTAWGYSEEKPKAYKKTSSPRPSKKFHI